MVSISYGLEFIICFFNMSFKYLSLIFFEKSSKLLSILPLAIIPMTLFDIFELDE